MCTIFQIFRIILKPYKLCIVNAAPYDKRLND